MRAMILFLLVVVLIGCRAEYEDASKGTEYSSVVGATYKILNRLKIHGVTMDRNYRKVIDVYAVTELPGFDGPEVITASYLEAGTIISVKSVLKCTTCWPTRFELVVDILSEQLESDVEVRLDDLSTTTEGNIRELNSNLFMRLDK